MAALKVDEAIDLVLCAESVEAVPLALTNMALLVVGHADVERTGPASHVKPVAAFGHDVRMGPLPLRCCDWAHKEIVRRLCKMQVPRLGRALFGATSLEMTSWVVELCDNQRFGQVRPNRVLRAGRASKESEHGQEALL